MYERHFGLTDSPFRLSPDPYFLFESDQHRPIWEAMRRAFADPRPFIVLSGEVGAGKTTLVRAWMDECEAAGASVAQLTNTQLSADELISAVAVTFGVAHAGDAQESAEQLDATFAKLFREWNGRRALLVVDEAQNLEPSALRCLIALGDRAAEAGIALRICLAGQPELRARVSEAALPDLRARVQAMHHLVPLRLEQTRQYVEHRLAKVGWTDRPSFDAEAFDEIHRATGGVPRRINVVCSRLLLTQFLEDGDRIDAATVRSAASALRAEIGEGVTTPVPSRPVPPIAAEGAAPGAGAVDAGALAAATLVPVEAAPAGQDRPAAPTLPAARSASAPAPSWMIVVAHSRSDHIEAAPILRALATQPDAPKALLVSLSNGDPWRIDHELHVALGLERQPLVLIDPSARTGRDLPEVFTRLLERYRPVAALLFNSGDAALHCAEVASRCAVPLVHLRTRATMPHANTVPLEAAQRIAQLASLELDAVSWREPGPPTIGVRAPVRVGSLLHAAFRFATQSRAGPNDGVQGLGGMHLALTERRGYGVVVLSGSLGDSASVTPRSPIVRLLRELSRDLPLVWPAGWREMLAMLTNGVARAFEGDRVACVEEMDHVAFLSLLRDARCVFTDCLDVMEEAAFLGLPCLALGAQHPSATEAGGWVPSQDIGHSTTRATRAVWQLLFSGGARAAPLIPWDGRAGEHVAAALMRWLGDATVPIRPAAAVAQPPV